MRKLSDTEGKFKEGRKGTKFTEDSVLQRHKIFLN